MTTSASTQGSPITPSMMARHPIYPVILRTAGLAALRPDYRVPGRGATKQELVEAVEDAFPGHYSQVTVRSYITHMARFGLLTGRGRANARRYLPPGEEA